MIWNDFSIIIVTKNRYKQLQESIKSVCENSLLPKRIIIIDSSKKKNLQVIASLQKLCRHVDISFQYLYKNYNLAQNRNIGIQLIETAYFSFIDDDQYAPRDWVKNLKTIISKKPNINVITGPTWSKHPHNYWNNIWHDIDSYRRKTMGYVDMIPSSNSCFQTSFLKKNQIKFNPSFTLAGEDWGFSYELNKHNAKMYQTPKLFILHDYRITLFDFLRQWFFYGIGVSQYHRYYLKKDKDMHCASFLTLLTKCTPKYPIRPNNFKPYLWPGYYVLNVSYLAGYIYDNLIMKHI